MEGPEGTVRIRKRGKSIFFPGFQVLLNYDRKYLVFLIKMKKGYHKA